MSKFGTLIMGPAGAGKTTFCSALIQFLRNNRRACFYVNLDPAAEDFFYQPDLDIKELISLEDVMEEMGLGPNGGLIYCFEFLLDNLDFMSEALNPLGDDCLLIIDMPGQIELYTHIPLVPRLAEFLTQPGALNIRLCATYLLESTFVVDHAKFFAGTLSAMSAMLLMEIPHINVLSKMDLVKGQVPKREFKRFTNPDASLLDDRSTSQKDPYGANSIFAGPSLPAGENGDLSSKQSLIRGRSFVELNRAVAGLIDEFSMVSFLQLDVQDENSVESIVSYIDDAIQFHEAQEPKEPKDETIGDAYEAPDLGL